MGTEGEPAAANVASFTALKGVPLVTAWRPPTRGIRLYSEYGPPRAIKQFLRDYLAPTFRATEGEFFVDEVLERTFTSGFGQDTTLFFEYITDKDAAAAIPLMLVHPLYFSDVWVNAVAAFAEDTPWGRVLDRAGDFSMAAFNVWEVVDTARNIVRRNPAGVLFDIGVAAAVQGALHLQGVLRQSVADGFYRTTCKDDLVLFDRQRLLNALSLEPEGFIHLFDPPSAPASPEETPEEPGGLAESLSGWFAGSVLLWVEQNICDNLKTLLGSRFREGVRLSQSARDDVTEAAYWAARALIQVYSDAIQDAWGGTNQPAAERRVREWLGPYPFWWHGPHANEDLVWRTTSYLFAPFSYYPDARDPVAIRDSRDLFQFETEHGETASGLCHSLFAKAMSLPEVAALQGRCAQAVTLNPNILGAERDPGRSGFDFDLTAYKVDGVTSMLRTARPEYPGSRWVIPNWSRATLRVKRSIALGVQQDWIEIDYGKRLREFLQNALTLLSTLVRKTGADNYLAMTVATNPYPAYDEHSLSRSLVWERFRRTVLDVYPEQAMGSAPASAESVLAQFQAKNTGVVPPQFVQTTAPSSRQRAPSGFGGGALGLLGLGALGLILAKSGGGGGNVGN